MSSPESRQKLNVYSNRSGSDMPMLCVQCLEQYIRVDRVMWRDGWYLPVLDGVDEHDGAASDRETRAWGFFERRR